MAFITNMDDQLRDLAVHNPDKLREMICTEEFEALWVRAFRNLLGRSSEKAVKLYAQLRKLLGTGDQFNVNIQAQLGMGPEQVGKLIGAARDAMEMSEGERFETCIAYLEARIREDPAKRLKVMDRLGGRIESNNGSRVGAQLLGVK